MKKKSGGQIPGPRGQKRALTPAQVQYLLALLQGDVESGAHAARRNLALFRTGLCTMLRVGDLLSLKISDIWNEGNIRDHVLVTQQKTTNPVQCILQEETRTVILNHLLDVYGSIDAIQLNLDNPVFELSKRQYGSIVKIWAKRLNLDPKYYNTHSLRRTKAKEIYRQTRNVEVIRQLLGHSSLQETGVYLGVDLEEALDVSRIVKF